MRLVVIYGPPAAGKLTVAKELAKITGYKVLHNHLVIDLVESVFTRDDPRFWELINTYRLDMIEKAAKGKVDGIILTLVNIKGRDDIFIKKILETIENTKGAAYFVRLVCHPGELRKRLVEPSRKEYGKLTDLKIFEEFISQNDVFSKISFVDALEIDNTTKSTIEVANNIKRHYKM